LESLSSHDFGGETKVIENLKGKHVIILGKGNSGRICPFDADETWGVNNVAGQTVPCPDCDNGKIDNKPCPKCNGTNVLLMYPQKIHKLFAFDESLEQQYTDEMKKYAPIVSFQKYADVKYPLEDILIEFNTRYFTNTISYMIAYAIHCKVKKISVYGVDVSFGAPYAQENRGVEYWMGRAEQCGIEVYCPDKSHLLRTVYGNLYGEIGHCNMLLYVHERINLINLLPREGTYSDSIKAQNAWWVLFPKEDEAKAHGLQVQRGTDGSMSFGFLPGFNGDYVSDVQMPPEVWAYLRELLRDLESKGKLPFGAISVYEKLILAKEEPKSEVGSRNDPIDAKNKEV
jgi:hypothetical protein